MTDDTLLSRIRAKCIEANPEIVEMCCGNCGTEYGNPFPCRTGLKFYPKHRAVRTKGRPIRLADVLLAMGGATQRTWYVSTAGRFIEEDYGIQRYQGERTNWNLRADDLEAQSQETLEFIGKVLGV